MNDAQSTTRDLNQFLQHFYFTADGEPYIEDNEFKENSWSAPLNSASGQKCLALIQKLTRLPKYKQLAIGAQDYFFRCLALRFRFDFTFEEKSIRVYIYTI